MRAALKPAHGQPRLYIHPRCKRLIAAMHAYRYAEGGSEIPLKDNNSDHLMDALRYFFVNYSSSDGPNHRRY
jgi:phage terminase large subunit